MKLTVTLLAVLLLLTTFADSATFQVFYTFSGPDGSSPNGDLIRDSVGNFYGTSQAGGTANKGVVFKLTASGQETVLYSFTNGTDGGTPIGRLLSSNGNFYGMTATGGDASCGCGTVFKVTTGGTLTVLHTFTGTDGKQIPSSHELGLVLINGNLYGSTGFGGDLNCDITLGCGVIFKVAPNHAESVVYSFMGKADGAGPQDLIPDSEGNIYGAAGFSYMAGNAGTIFKIDSAGNLTTVYTFPGGATGSNPAWRLVRSNNGVIHGVTVFGGDTSCSLGTAGCGVAYRLDSSNTETVLHTFGQTTNDGQTPAGALLSADGKFYGVTGGGGNTNSICPLGCGTVYQVDDSSNYTVLYRFTGGNDGAFPTGALTSDGAGNLYGAADLGGTAHQGEIFKITP